MTVIFSTLLMSVEYSHVGRYRNDLDHCDHEVVNDHDEGGKISKGGNPFNEIVFSRLCTRISFSGYFLRW
jgi:hypothetical protein